MKKITALLLALMMLAGVLAGCGKPQDAGKAGKLKVVTTIFPEYDWVRAILGDKAENAEVTMLLDNGVDLHSYQPTADDIVFSFFAAAYWHPPKAGKRRTACGIP